MKIYIPFSLLLSEAAMPITYKIQRNLNLMSAQVTRHTFDKRSQNIKKDPNYIVQGMEEF